MDILGSLIGAPRAGGWVSKPADDDYWYTPRSGPTAAGVNVDELSAMTFASVFACVAKKSKTIASLPVGVFEETGPRQSRAIDHDLWWLLNEQANPEATGLTVRETMLANEMLWGFAVAEVKQGRNNGKIEAIYPLESKYVTPCEDINKQLYFEYKPPDMAVPQELPLNRVLHFPGLSLNGRTGLSVIGCNRLTVGLGLAATMFGASFFGNGAWAGGFVKRSAEADKLAPMSKEAGERFITALNEKFKGPDKAFGFGLLREGMEFTQLEMPFEDAMFLETRRFTREDICAIFDVPPSKIHDNTRSTFSNSEQQDLQWAKDSLLPECRRIEAVLNSKFFARSKIRVKHNLTALMRGDFASRMAGYATARQWGWLSVNDIRELEDLNPVEGGDEYLRPMNMIPVGQEPEQVQPKEPPPPRDVQDDKPADEQARVPTVVVINTPPQAADPAKSASVPTPALRPMLADAAQRIVAKECNAITNAWKRRSKEPNTESFASWLEGFYREHVGMVVDCVAPAMDTYTALSGKAERQDRCDFAGQYCANSCERIEALLGKPERIPGLVDEWRARKAGELTEQLMGLITEE